MKQEHTGSISEAEKYENDDLIENGDNVEKWEDAVSVIKGYKNIIKIKEKNIISVTYRKKKLGIKNWKLKNLNKKKISLEWSNSLGWVNPRWYVK